MIYIKDDHGYSWYFNGKNMVVINGEGEDDSYECNSLEEGIKLLNDNGHITSVEKDPLWIFVFANNWDHSQDDYYHPEIIIANSISKALEIFAKETYGFVSGGFVVDKAFGRNVKVYQYVMNLGEFGTRIDNVRIYMYPVIDDTMIGLSDEYRGE